jgi:hypothetical protein
MADVATFLTYFQENKLSLSALERLAYRQTMPFFPDDWTIGTNNAVLLVVVACILAFDCCFFSYLTKLEPEKLRQKQFFVQAVSAASGLVLALSLLSLIIPRETIYLVEATEAPLISGFYTFDVMGQTKDSYEIPVMNDYQIAEDGFDAEPTLSFRKSDLRISDVFEYDQEETTLGDYRSFKEKLKSGIQAD